MPDDIRVVATASLDREVVSALDASDLGASTATRTGLDRDNVFGERDDAGDARRRKDRMGGT